jgi:ribosomal 50S subunit-recycling heat shock protein
MSDRPVTLASRVTCHFLGATPMRLDQFLRASRLVLRRTVAQELCAAGAVLVNGAPARPARTIRAGDQITLRRRHRLLTVRVTMVPEARQTSRHEAPMLYEILSDSRVDDELWGE